MRTVHETEALRPSDPVPKSMQVGPPGKSSKLKIIIKTPQSHSNGGEGGSEESGHGEDGNSDYFTPLTSELFTEEELAFSVDKLYRKCFWENKWAGEVGDTLKQECKEWEEVYYNEWLEKEVLLSQVIKSEVDWHERRQAILTGSADVQIKNGTTVEDKPAEGQQNGVKESAAGETENATSRPTEAVAA